jgi:hypothetical protein
MRNLSLRGVSRKHLGISSAISVRDDVFPGPPIAASVSLRTRLGSLARKQHSFELSEPRCTYYGGTAAFEQTWTHIRVRIQLHPDAGIPSKTLEALRSTWSKGIKETWSDQRGCGRRGEIACPLTFEVLWVTSDEHHAVAVHKGPGRSNMYNWHTTDGGDVAAHEFGHMIGLADEYPDPNCPNRRPVDTGTIMDDLGGTIPDRLLKRLADNLGSTIVGI